SARDYPGPWQSALVLRPGAPARTRFAAALVRFVGVRLRIVSAGLLRAAATARGLLFVAGAVAARAAAVRPVGTLLFALSLLFLLVLGGAAQVDAGNFHALDALAGQLFDGLEQFALVRADQ